MLSALLTVASLIAAASSPTSLSTSPELFDTAYRPLLPTAAPHRSSPHSPTLTRTSSASISATSTCVRPPITPGLPSALPDFKRMSDERLLDYAVDHCFDPKNPPPRDVIEFYDSLVGGAMQEFHSRYNVGSGYGSVGTPQTVTWSLIPDGILVPQPPLHGPQEVDAPSRLFEQLDADFNGTRAWINVIDAALQRWGALSGINFVRVTFNGNDWDDGAPFHSPASPGLRGDLRIGGHHIDGPGGTLGYNYWPANGGNMVLDTSDHDWSTYSSSPQHIRLFNVIMHESGHGQGIQHSCPVNGTKLMEPSFNTSFIGAQHDDVRASMELYGDAHEPNNSLATATDVGVLAFNQAINLSAIQGSLPYAPPPPNITSTAIDIGSDADVFRFNLAQGAPLSLIATPVGYLYPQGAQGEGGCGPGVVQDSGAVSQLRVEVLDSTGAFLASSIAPALGEPAICTVPATGTGFHYARISVVNYGGSSQMYSAAIGAGFVPPPSNDSCFDAVPFSVNTGIAGTNIGATQDAPAPCGGTSSADVWYSITPTCSGLLTLDLCNSGFDTTLAIYSGVCGQLSLIECNDDAPLELLCAAQFQSALSTFVSAGQTYLVRVAGYNASAGGFYLRSGFEVPANDSCYNAESVTPGNSYAAATCGADSDGIANCVGVSGNDIWYAYTPDVHHLLVLSTFGSDFDTVLSVCTGSCDDLIEIACNDDASQTDQTSALTVSAFPGVTYRIRVAGLSGAAGNAILHVDGAQVNDYCANAITITSGSVVGDTTFARHEGASTCNPLAPAGDVWYQWTAPCSADAIFNTCGSSLDTVITVYSGPCNRLTQLACNDDNDGAGPCPAQNFASYLSLPAVAGETYFIAVRGFNSDHGAFTLNVQQNANSTCATATPITQTTTLFDTTCAPVSTLSGCPLTFDSPTLWYAYTPTCSGAASIDTCGSLFDTTLAVFSACDLSAPIACNNDAAPGGPCPAQTTASAVTFSAQSGATYYVRVAGHFGAAGPGRLNVRCATACPCDWNQSGDLNSQDFFDFLSAFFTNNADFNNSGATNSQDFFDFLACFFTGC